MQGGGQGGWFVIRFSVAVTKNVAATWTRQAPNSFFFAGKQTKFARQPNRTNVRAGVSTSETSDKRLPHSSRPRGRSPWQILADTFVR